MRRRIAPRPAPPADGIPEPVTGGTWLYCTWTIRPGPGQVISCAGGPIGNLGVRLPWRIRIARGGMSRFRRHYRSHGVPG